MDRFQRKRVPSGRVMVLAASDAGRDRVHNGLKADCPTVFVAPHGGGAETVALHDVAALVIVLEPEGFVDSSYKSTVHAALERLGDDPCFRVFLAHDLDPSTVEDLVQRDLGNGVTLQDVVQYDVDVQLPTAELLDFLHDLPTIRDANAWARIRVRVLGVAGYAVSVAQIAAALAVVGFCVSDRGLQVDPTTLHPWISALAAVSAGLLLPPVVSVVLVLPRWFRCGGTPMEARRLGFAIVLSTALLYGVFFILFPALEGRLAPFWPAIIAGFVLDNLRRESLRARLSHIRFSARVGQVRRSFQERRGALLRTAPLGMPWVTDWRPRVFISYRHRGDGPGAADRVWKMLEGLDGEVFHDSRTLKKGDGWRRALGQQLGGANIVLFLVDEDYLASDMCLGEMFQAFETTRRTGAPTLSVLMREPLRKGNHPDDLPPGLGKVLAGLPRSPAIILRHWTDEDLKLVASWVKRGWRGSQAVLRGISGGVVVLGAHLLHWVGNAGFFAAWLAIPAAVALAVGLDHSIGALGSLRHPGLGLAAAFWAGFVGRLTLYSWFSLFYSTGDPANARRKRRQLGLSHGFMTIAHLGLAAAVLLGASALLWGWATAVFLLGATTAIHYATVTQHHLAVLERSSRPPRS